MAREVVLPELAESVVEGEILKWLVGEGDEVALEQPIVEVMTDKVTVELPSPVAGRLEKQLVREGDVVPVHAPIALIGEGAAPPAPEPAPVGEQAAQQAVQASAENPITPHLETPHLGTQDLATAQLDLPVTAQEERSIVEAGAVEPAGDDQSLFKAFTSDEPVKVPSGLGQHSGGQHRASGAQEEAAAFTPHGRVLAVPAARQLARELGLDLARVKGSGPNGRVRVADVHHFAVQSAPPAPSSGGLPVPPVPYRTPRGYEDRETRTPLRGLRRAISNQMLASHLYTVRTLTVDEANLTRLVALRERLKGDAQQEGVKLSYLPFIFKAIVSALRKFPSLNTSFDEAKQEIVHKNYYNLGLAVATEAGLVVPVVRDADRKSLLQLAREVQDLAERARGGRLSPEDMSGSSFSVTNIGSVGALMSFPIINVPDAAILGVHSVVKRPVFDEHDQVVAGHMMYLSLSFDHRLVDGAEAARFCREVIRLLENPETLMLAMG